MPVSEIPTNPINLEQISNLRKLLAKLHQFEPYRYLPYRYRQTLQKAGRELLDMARQEETAQSL